jgi:hypothetical protein
MYGVGRMKLIILEECNEQCPYYRPYLQVYDAPPFCQSRLKRIDKHPFPDWCPMEDVE